MYRAFERVGLSIMNLSRISFSATTDLRLSMPDLVRSSTEEKSSRRPSRSLSTRTACILRTWSGVSGSTAMPASRSLRLHTEAVYGSACDTQGGTVSAGAGGGAARGAPH